MKKILILLAAAAAVFTVWKLLQPVPAPPSAAVAGQLQAEKFIRGHLLQKDGRIATDLQSRNGEYLSETAGLWMEYLVLQGDEQTFSEQKDVVEKYFLTDDYLVTWMIEGKKKAPANAFIDDLRIMNALYDAGEKFNNRAYSKLAKKMESALERYQVRDGLFIDHINTEGKEQGQDVTLSYIIPAGLDRMKNSKGYEATRALLLEAPADSRGFFPKTYHLQTKEYSHEEEVNMIDQLYLAYHRAQWGGDVSGLLQFLQGAFGGKEKLYGRYDLSSGLAAVGYESAAVYALGVLLALEADEQEFAAQLYEKMKAMQQLDESQPYYGGYIDETATIAVKGGNQKLYTNAAQLAVASAQGEEADEAPQAGISAAWLTGFGVLLLFAAGSVWYVIRQRKRKLPADETKE